MKKHIKILLGLGCTLLITAVAVWYLGRYTVDVLQPAGQIGAKERNLLIACGLLSITVVVPVFWMLFHFAWKYRAGNAHAAYEPNQHGSWQLETVWWLIPTALMVVISVITWRSSYALDPFKSLESSKPTLHVQVVALDWKWLFIYPDRQFASLNEVAVPVDTPVEFTITSDTVMTSFWAPQLGGQMYAMPGMSTALNLQADRVGAYRGVAANISGKGFSDMRFTVRAMSDADYEAWVARVQRSPKQLDTGTYATLAQQETRTDTVYYSSAQPGLYDTIVMKYMMPMGQTHTESGGSH